MVRGRGRCSAAEAARPRPAGHTGVFGSDLFANQLDLLIELVVVAAKRARELACWGSILWHFPVSSATAADRPGPVEAPENCLLERDLRPG